MEQVVLVEGEPPTRVHRVATFYHAKRAENYAKNEALRTGYTLITEES